MLGNKFGTYAELEAFVKNNTTVVAGKYFVDVDETMNNVPSEYLVDSSKKISLINETTLYNAELF